MKRRREKERRTRGREECWRRGGKEGVGWEGRKEKEEERRRGGTLQHHLQEGGECAWRIPLLPLPPLHWQVHKFVSLSFPFWHLTVVVAFWIYI